MPELDIADGSGTRFKANVDYRLPERHYSLSKRHRSNMEPFESQGQNASEAAALTKKHQSLDSHWIQNMQITDFWNN